MGWIIDALDLDMAQQRESFARQWSVPEVRIIVGPIDDVGWLQTAPSEDAIFLKQLFVDSRFRRQGIGSHVVSMLIEEATSTQKAVALAVVKINPARRLYARLGFHVTHEDQHKIQMRRDPD
jgi:ribosomal protein S18 acetylase RimI-like enzyme